jgi:general secretion pathway protein E
MEEDGSSIISEIEERADLLDDISDAPIIKLVNHIISQSVKARASDIHIEP